MQSIAELNREYERRAKALGLIIDCLADGAFNAQIAIVAEAPGEREVALKVPLVGGSGQLVWRTLSKYGITRRDVYITNVVKKQLSYSEDQDKIKVPKAEFDHWEALLKWELAHLPNLRYVIILGNMPLKALLGKDGIEKWRGSVLDFDITSHNPTQPRIYKAVCTFNPAHVLRFPRNEISFAMDMGKLELVTSGKFKPYEITGHTVTEYKKVVEVLDHLHALPNETPISWDIETAAGETACVGFSADGHEGWCIPFRSDQGNHYLSLDEETDVRRRMQSLFNGVEQGGPARRFIAQNANFDMCWLWYKDRIRVHKAWLDTMLAHHCLYPTLPHDLGYLTTQYTTHPYYKDERTAWRDKGDIGAYWAYNIKDACLTWEIARKLKKELEDQKLDQFFFDHIMRLQPHLVRMTVGGILIDTESKTKIAEELREQVATLLNNFHDQVGRITGDNNFRPNPNSRPQLAQLLFGHLKLIGRGTSTDAANRKRMLEHSKTSEEAKGIIRTIDKYKEEHKFLSTYAESGVDPDDRMRCEWKQTGVKKAPGRLSSASVMWGSGMNLQNQPPRARGMFIADRSVESLDIPSWAKDKLDALDIPKDFVFVYFDLTQAESQYVGWDANIPSWKEQYTKARLEGGGYDSHRALASQMFKVPYDQVPTFDHDDNHKPTIRYKAKRARHGLNYRMAADRLAEASGMSIFEANETYTLYHRLHPEIRKWWAALEHEVKTTKMLFNAYGRRLYFLERLNSDEALESIVAFKPQSTIGDKVSRVIYMSHDDEEWPFWGRIAMNIHDALIAIVPEDKAKTAMKVMKKHAEEPINIRGEQLIISAELGMSQPDETGKHRWSTIKKVKSL